MMDTSLSHMKDKLAGIVDHLKGEVASLRTGRATPALVENIMVDYYGTPTELKALASIASPQPRELLIQPWDRNVVPAIEKAIQSSSLGLAPVTDREAIRLSIPPLTEERRKELVKMLGRHLEDARIKVRQEREEMLRDIDRRCKAKELSEDGRFRERNEVQKAVDEINKKIEETGRMKEREIMTV